MAQTGFLSNEAIVKAQTLRQVFQTCKEIDVIEFVREPNEESILLLNLIRLFYSYKGGDVLQHARNTLKQARYENLVKNFCYKVNVILKKKFIDQLQRMCNTRKNMRETLPERMNPKTPSTAPQSPSKTPSTAPQSPSKTPSTAPQSPSKTPSTAPQSSSSTPQSIPSSVATFFTPSSTAASFFTASEGVRTPKTPKSASPLQFADNSPPVTPQMIAEAQQVLNEIVQQAEIPQAAVAQIEQLMDNVPQTPQQVNEIVEAAVQIANRASPARQIGARERAYLGISKTHRMETRSSKRSLRSDTSKTNKKPRWK
jgi:hypothetical protein